MRPLPCRAQVLADYAAGVRTGELVRRYGCSRSTIGNWVRGAGATPHVNGVGPLPLPPVDEIYNLYRQLGSFRKVAKALGCSLTTVLRRVNGDVIP